MSLRRNFPLFLTVSLHPVKSSGKTGHHLQVTVGFCIFVGENAPIKSKSPRHRCVVVPSYGGSLPLAGLPITVRKDHVVQIARDEVVQHRIYHTPFLLYGFYQYYMRLPPFLQVLFYTFLPIFFWYFLARCTVPLALWQEILYNRVSYFIA